MSTTNQMMTYGYRTLLSATLLLLTLMTGAANAITYCQPADYRAQRPDIAGKFSANRHYLIYGINEGMCRPLYNCTRAEYLAMRPDVASANVDPMTHYNASGKAEVMCQPNLSDLINATSYSNLPDAA